MSLEGRTKRPPWPPIRDDAVPPPSAPEPPGPTSWPLSADQPERRHTPMLNVGIIGTGNISGAHIAAYLTFPDEVRSEEHTSELQSRGHLVCRLLLERKMKHTSGHPLRL